MKSLLSIVALILFSSSVLSAQTIADVARRERAKKPPAQSTVTITNANLRKKNVGTTAVEEKKPETAAAPAAAPAASKPAPAAAPANATPAPAAAADTRDEKWWRTQFETARTDIRRAENQAAVAQLDLNLANKDYLTRAYDPDGRGPAAIAAATKRLEEANKAVAAGRARLAQLDDDLRRAGAPAGWGR